MSKLTIIRYADPDDLLVLDKVTVIYALFLATFVLKNWLSQPNGNINVYKISLLRLLQIFKCSTYFVDMLPKS